LSKSSSVLVYGTNMGGYRAAYAFAKMGYPVILLNRGAYVDEVHNQLLAQLPLDFCWICGHMPQRLFKALGSLKDNYNAQLLEVSGQAGNFTVKFKKRDQTVNNFACIECDKCIEVCPVEVGDRKAIHVLPKAGWENIYVIDREHCTECGKCEEVCPTQCLKLDRPEEVVEEKVGVIVLAHEYEAPSDEELKGFAAGKSPSVIRNSEIADRSLLTNFVRESVQLPSGKIPASFAIVVTPDFSEPGIEFGNPNLSVSAAYRAVCLKRVIPEADVTIYLGDYRAAGKGHEAWRDKALKAGARIVRADSLKVVPGKGETATVEYERDGEVRQDSAELVILITGQKPSSLTSEMERICGVKTDQDGFCNVRPFSSCETDVDGIFAVGEFSGAKANTETVWEGCAALTESLKYLGPRTFKPEPPPELENTRGQVPKTGVFICSCFGAFAERMDLQALADRAAKLPHVAHAEIIEGCCTPPTIKQTAERIKASGVNRIVLAVCTPLQKLLKYRKTAMMAGLNPLLSEYVRLREDVINVHRDRDKMLAKAEALIKGAVEKVRFQSQAPPPMDAFGDTALIIGGGPAALTAADSISRGGFGVTIVERGGELGARSDGLTAGQKEFVQGLAERLESEPSVTICTESEVARVGGYAGNFDVTLRGPDGETQTRAAIILIATGADCVEPKGFLYGEAPGVVTQLELRQKIEGGETPKRVAMIQSVGSGDEEYPNRSYVCSEEALGNAIELKKKGSEVAIFSGDTPTCGNARLYKRAKEAGVRFVHLEDGADPTVAKGDGSLVVTSGDGTAVEADVVALTPGIAPNKENNEALSRIIGHPLDKEGFFESDASAYPFEEAIKRVTKPFELMFNGIFPVGLAHSPRSFDAALLTARDAAGRAMVMLSKPKMPPPNAMYLAEVKESLCSGCGICVQVCPYSARQVDPLSKVATVHPFLCDSCGSCVVACPSNASHLRDFMHDQITAALDAVLV
jgi:heterodisulfide reductase subunit A